MSAATPSTTARARREGRSVVIRPNEGTPLAPLLSLVTEVEQLGQPRANVLKLRLDVREAAFVLMVSVTVSRLSIAASAIGVTATLACVCPIGIVTVVADHGRRRGDRPAYQIVGNVQ